MPVTFTITAIFSIGFFHAFEADHLAAVSTLVTKRDNILAAVRDGIYWGLGHTSTIFLIGMMMIILKFSFLDNFFTTFEGIIGLLLVAIGIKRLYELFYSEKKHEKSEPHTHKVAYGVGLLHGLAGSGSVVLLIISNVPDSWNGMLYLLIFGMGSILGMLIAAGLFSLPFSKKITKNIYINMTLVIISSLVCMSIGGWLFYENLM